MSEAGHEQDPGGDRFTISFDDEQHVPVDVPSLRRVAERALELLSVPDGAALAVTFVEAGRMAELKEQALGEKAPTDVLAFPMDDVADPMPGPFVVGDVVICPEAAEGQELSLLLVHGILHCLGRDHATPGEEKAMFAEQAEILSAAGAAR
ncbi:MAG TPA: rRNA maturation RNase YbeY [Actinomycetota bacterium]|nr:rRNA maturation RNase YbeY [Actinomycetota bacterium]